MKIDDVKVKKRKVDEKDENHLKIVKKSKGDEKHENHLKVSKKRKTDEKGENHLKIAKKRKKENFENVEPNSYNGMLTLIATKSPISKYTMSKGKSKAGLNFVFSAVTENNNVPVVDLTEEVERLTETLDERLMAKFGMRPCYVKLYSLGQSDMKALILKDIRKRVCSVRLERLPMDRPLMKPPVAKTEDILSSLLTNPFKRVPAMEWRSNYFSNFMSDCLEIQFYELSSEDKEEVVDTQADTIESVSAAPGDVIDLGDPEFEILADDDGEILDVIPYDDFYHCLYPLPPPQWSESQALPLGSDEDEAPYMCDTCHKPFKNDISYSRHMFGHSSQLLYHCRFCAKSFSSNEFLQRHAIVHTGKPRFKCEVCPQMFDESLDLKRHRLSHSSDPSFRCALCAKQYPSFKNLLKHLRQHEENKPFRCNLCPCRFRMAEFLTKHMMTHQTQYKCRICGYSCALDQLKKHLLTHEIGDQKLLNDKPIEVSDDDTPKVIEVDPLAIAPPADPLQTKTRHRSKDPAELPHACEVCGKRYKNRCNLNRHMYNHTNNWPNRCHICNRGFSLPSEVIQHLNVHNVNKMYSCTMCDQSFSHPNHLSNHMASHQPKMFACGICKRMFSDSRYLKLHMSSVHTEVRLECQVCKLVSTNRQELYKHIRTHFNGVDMKKFDINMPMSLLVKTLN